MNLPRKTSFPLAAGLATVALVAALVAAPSCAHDSYLVVRMKAAAGTLAGVTQVTVMVTDHAHGTPMATRTFNVAADAGLGIDASDGKTFSLSFTPDRSDSVDVSVTAYVSATCMASGTQSAVPLNKGHVANTTVTLVPTATCPTPAGAADGGVTFMGCDPALAGSCAGGKTCYVDCTNQVGVCVAGGTRQAGEACSSNSDCMPGTQCFDYDCGSNKKYCLKFCNGDADCAGSTAVSATSLCSDPVVCPPQTTYKTCGFVCDPRGSGTTGCPAGLTCFLFKSSTGGQDAPACACPAASRVGVDGATCTGNEDCAPGFLCDQMAGGTFCRRLCQMATPGDCPGAQTCHALANNSTFGVCLSP
jgi:hypothetical protein